VATGNVCVFDDETGEPETAEVPSPPVGSLSTVGHESAVLGFGALFDTGPAASWLTDKPVIRQLTTRPGEDATMEFKIDPREEFDGLLFVWEARAVDDLGG
jgi:erythromycin esterase-like protein